MCRPVAIQGRSSSMLLAKLGQGGSGGGAGGAGWDQAQGLLEEPCTKEVGGDLGGKKPQYLPRWVLPTSPDRFC